MSWSGPVIEAYGNKHVAIDVEWFGQAVGKGIDDVVQRLRELRLTPNAAAPTRSIRLIGGFL